MGWVTFESGAGDLWEYVSLCESHDYVARLYEEYHGVAADEDKIREITASFAQGRTVFRKCPNGIHRRKAVAPVLRHPGPVWRSCSVEKPQQEGDVRDRRVMVLSRSIGRRCLAMA